MKIFILYSALIFSAFSTHAATVQLPDEATLTARVSSIMSEHFIEKTTLVKDLAGQKKAPLGVNRAVELAMYDYLAELPPVVKMTATMNKPLLVRAILEDHPAAIAELVSMGLLK